MKPTTQSNLTNRSIWQRILFMILFGIAFSIAEVVMAFVVVVQTLFVLFTGEQQTTIKQFGNQLSEYIYQIVRFLTFNSEEQPFPFSDWPK